VNNDPEVIKLIPIHKITYLTFMSTDFNCCSAINSRKPASGRSARDDQQSEKLGPSRNNTQSLLSRAWDLMETDEKDKLEETYTVAEQLMAFLSSIASSKLVVCL